MDRRGLTVFGGSIDYLHAYIYSFANNSRDAPPPQVFLNMLSFCKGLASETNRMPTAKFEPLAMRFPNRLYGKSFTSS